jgi:outer membrane protein OmpA-like peptidoglycan-associated protein
MLQYQTGGTNKFYAALGAKIGFPISATAKTDDYTVTTSGYYPAEGRTYDDLPQYGFGTYNYQGSTTDVAFRISAMASAEMGAKWKISNKNALYTGIYIDYGFTNIQKTKDKPFVQSALTADNPPMSPLVESQHAGTSFTGNITPLAVGLKLRFAFGCGKDFQNPVRRPVETRHATSPQQQPPPVDNSAVEAQAAAEAEAQAQATRQREAAQAEARRLEQEKAAARQTAKNTIQKPVENYKMSQTTLTTAQKAALDEKVELLQQNPDIEVFIYGHTCNIGGDKINDKIGLQRAQNAKAYLISKGITPNRITGAASKRDTEPLIPNTTEENRTKNRRIEIIVQQ